MAKQRLQDRPRYASGRAKPQSKAAAEAERMATVLKQRQEHFMRYLAAPGEPATDARYGSVIGKLSLQNIISLTQYDAALAYERLRRDYLGLATEAKPTAPSVLASMVFGGGRSCAPDIDEDLAKDKKREHADMIREVEELERFEGANGRHFGLVDLLDRVTVYDLEMALTPANVASLRSSLNVLAKFFKLTR